MKNMIIGKFNRIDSSVVSGGSYHTTLPLSNIKIRQLSSVARTFGTNMSSSIINIDQGSVMATDLIAIAGHNFTTAAKVRIRIDLNGTMVAPVADSGWKNVYTDGVIPQELLEWEDDNFWGGLVSPQCKAGYQSPYIFAFLTRPVGRYCRIEIDDQTNSDGYIQYGRVFIGDSWTPAHNVSYGITLGVDDPTDVAVSLGQTEYFFPRRKTRSLNFTLNYLTNNEAYGQAMDLMMISGISGEVVIVTDPDDTSNGFRRNIFGRFKNLTPMTHVNYGQRTISFNVKEII